MVVARHAVLHVACHVMHSRWCADRVCGEVNVPAIRQDAVDAHVVARPQAPGDENLHTYD